MEWRRWGHEELNVGTQEEPIDEEGGDGECWGDIIDEVGGLTSSQVYLG